MNKTTEKNNPELESMIAKPMKEHAAMLREYMQRLNDRNIGCIFLLSEEDRAEGGVIGIDKSALARFICDMLEDDEVFAYTASIMVSKRMHREKFNA